MTEESLAVKYLEYMSKEDRGETYNDFFDWAGIPMEQRSDFALAAILDQARRIEQ
jgi:hypothetical protein